MDDTTLDLRFGKHGAYGIPETRQSVYGNNYATLHTAVLDLIKYAKPVFSTLVPADPHAQNFFLSIQAYSNRHIDGFLDSPVILPHPRLTETLPSTNNIF